MQNSNNDNDDISEMLEALLLGQLNAVHRERLDSWTQQSLYHVQLVERLDSSAQDLIAEFDNIFSKSEMTKKRIHTLIAGHAKAN